MNPIILISATILLCVFGLYFAGAGVIALLRSSRPGRSLFQVFLGLFALGLTGFVFVKNRPTFMHVFQSDYLADAERLEQLRSAKLTSDAAPASPGEWPQWRGVHRDGIATEVGLRTIWPAKGPPVLWRRPIHGGYSSIAVANGRLYTMDRVESQERVICLDASSGKDVWVHTYPVDYRGLDYGSGPRATPTIHDGRVYTVGATGVMLCLEAAPADGQAKVLWEHDLLAEFRANRPIWGVASSPLIEGNLVCVQPGGTDGSVAAFERVSGQPLWKALADPSGYSSPVATTAAGVRQIVCFTGKGLTGLRPTDGGQLWYFPWETMHDCNVATPIVAGDYVFISSDYQAGCALLQLTADGQGGVRADPVYIRRDKLMRNHFSSCVLHEGYLYGFDVSGTVGMLKCMDLRTDANTAQEKWVTRDLRKGCVLYADGHLLVLTEDGKLALVEATPKQFTRKAQVDVLSGDQCWALPALANGRLYLRNDKEVVCLDLRK